MKNNLNTITNNALSLNGVKICNIIKVLNIQQEDDCISGTANGGYSQTREMFCVYTDDMKYQKLYRYDETENILSDLLRKGYIPYDEYYGKENDNNSIQKHEMLEQELHSYLMNLSTENFKGVCYCREEIGSYNNKLCVIHGGQMHYAGMNLPAFQYRDSLDSKIPKIENCVGDPQNFIYDMKSFVEGYPMVQVIFSYYLSGPLKQILERTSDSVGEYVLVTSITGKSGSGKTTLTTTLRNVLFGKGGVVSNNVTSIALYRILRSAGICPVVRDDSSTDTQNSLSHLKDKVLDVYNIASGKCRITSNSDTDVSVYSPFIESREEYWSLSDAVKPIRQVEGYKYRILELYCNKGDLTKDAQEARRLSEMNGKYSGMAVLFLDYLVDNYTEQDVKNAYRESIKEMETILAEHELESRYANRTAVILTAARICEEAYQIKMDIEKIKKVMVDSICSFERRMEATPENKELELLYRRFKEKNTEGLGINDNYIVDAVGHYNHKKHYVSFLQRNPGEFVIPAPLMPIFISQEPLTPPSFWGYDQNVSAIDVGAVKGEHWDSVLNEWGARGILIRSKGRNSFTQTVKLNGTNTTCYHFNWRKIAQEFGDNSTLDMTRFVHDEEDEDIIF